LLFTVFGGVVLVAIGQQQQENGRNRVDITLNKTTEPQNKNRCVCVAAAAAAHDDDPAVKNNDAAVVVDDAVLVVVVHMLCVDAVVLSHVTKKSPFSHNLRNPGDNYHHRCSLSLSQKSHLRRVVLCRTERKEFCCRKQNFLATFFYSFYVRIG
jgi:hypothetical protein